jgi:hypothetical protein
MSTTQVSHRTVRGLLRHDLSDEGFCVARTCPDAATEVDDDSSSDFEAAKPPAKKRIRTAKL